MSHGESEHICISWESTTGIVGFWLQRGYMVRIKVAVVLWGRSRRPSGAAVMQGSPSWGRSQPCKWGTGICTSGVTAAVHNSPDEAPVFSWRNFPYKMVGEGHLKP